MLPKLIQIAKLICLLTLAALLLCATIAAGELAQLLPQAQKDIANVTIETQSTIAELNVAADNIGTLAAAANQTETQQAAYWDKTSAEMYKTMAALRLVIVRTNRTLNDNLGPQLGLAFADSDGLIRDTSTEMSQTSAALQGSLGNLAKASAAAAASMADPHIAETLSRVDDTASQLAGMSTQLNATAGHVEQMSEMAETRVRQLMKPASLAMRIAKTALGFTAEAGSIAAGFFK